MNKLLVFISLFCSAGHFAQAVKLVPYNTGFLPVRSYAGATSSNLIYIPVQLNYSNGNQMDYWSLTYRVNGVITNGTQNFPPDKLKFRFNSFDASTPYPKNNTPTTQNIGVNTALLPFSISNSYFVQNSSYNLEINGYFALTLKYDVQAEGGSYLTQYSSWTNYKVNLILEIRNRKGELMDSKPVSFDMQVHPDDTSPGNPTYGIQFDPNANNVLLEFKTAGDYANGVSKTFTKAFSTFSNTPYVVQVNALNNNLSSSSSNLLPINSIKLSVKDNQTQAITNTISLSTAQQNIISSAAHSSSKFFDTTYSTQAGDPNFFNKAYEQYSGTLIYSIIPQ
ncbi:hypothetical protein [Chryseobacterium sp. MDT2-18]|uniref:hypothetical protein n=1 Tax=Chryseobacterium sp. MDT2-18 TaxID=1259136 RepID=UPI00277F86BE|nr:hypothetical protein [Chryseobacterium sp. MDT2-18]MDQ0477957.1 hypothetical protein [Chryseobacterium sp. MDT2-18]